MHVVVTGISHKTAPLELREKLALDEDSALRVGRDLLTHAGACEAVALSTCNRTELYTYASDSLAASQAAVERLAKQAGVPAAELEPSVYSYSGDAAIAPPLPRHREPRLDGRRRGADRRPDEGRLPGGLRGRLHERRLQPALPPRPRGRQARAHRDGDRRASGERELGRRRARPAGVRQVQGPRRPDPRRRGDQRADGDAPQGARHRAHPGDEPDLRRRRGAGAAGRRPRRALRGPRRAPFGRRHRHLLDVGAALRRHPRTRRPRHEAPSPPAALLHRHRRAARPRPRDQPRRQRLPLRHRRPPARRRAEPRTSARRRPPRPSRSSPRSSTRSEAGCAASRWCRPSRACATPSSRSAAPSSSVSATV